MKCDIRIEIHKTIYWKIRIHSGYSSLEMLLTIAVYDSAETSLSLLPSSVLTYLWTNHEVKSSFTFIVGLKQFFAFECLCFPKVLSPNPSILTNWMQESRICVTPLLDMTAVILLDQLESWYDANRRVPKAYTWLCMTTLSILLHKEKQVAAL